MRAVLTSTVCVAVLVAFASATITTGDSLPKPPARVGALEEAAALTKRFAAFKAKHKRQYASEAEEAAKFAAYAANMRRAAELQRRNPHATFGENEYADVSAADFKAMHSAESYFAGAKQRAADGKLRLAAVNATLAASAPSSIDWRAKGAVTYVKNQGLKCGSCWSFSTTGNIEGQWFLAGNALVALSEQMLVSCDTIDDGCHGGLPDNAFQWLLNTENGGIAAEAAYPYVSGNGNVPLCAIGGGGSSSASGSGTLTAAAQIANFVDIPRSESSMAAYLATHGPVSIGVDANSWQTYNGGVLTECQATQVDHAVLAVGYDLAHNPPYWIVKNSWGPAWGEDGYIRVQYGVDACLITTAPSSSTV